MGRQSFLQPFEAPLHLAFHGAGLDCGQSVDCFNQEIAGFHVFHGPVFVGFAQAGAPLVRGHGKN